MLPIMTAHIRKHFYPLLLLILTLIISFANYEPGTWLTGWDTLHPEFNFSLNFERIINGVWREEQGLGAVAAHAHMSELPRYIILWLFSWVFPLSFLRYSYIFLCLIVGPLGMYYFLRHVLKNIHASFLGAMVYIFNIAVLHHFTVPFEMFPTQYAFLPWLFLVATRFVEKQKQSDIVWFFVLTFLATPMAYAPQLWYAYFFALTTYVFLLSYRWYGKTKNFLKISGILIGMTLMVNSFWLLPHLYHLKNNAYLVPQAHINELFSERMFAFNKARGTIGDVAILQGSLYDWTKYNGEEFVPLFDEWAGHIDKWQLRTIGYLVFGTVLVGLLFSLLNKNKTGIALLPALFLSFAILMNMNPPFDIVFGPLRTYFPLLKEALRSPYTKFSIVLLFTYSFFAAFAAQWFLQQVGKTKRAVVVCLSSVLLVLYMFPFFRGLLIDPEMKIQIPNEYFELFSWFEKQRPDERIATVPYHTFWAWEYYKFGYQGAGFLWFGLPQPLLVRDFDRWNPNNENFYWEVSYAAYKNDLALLEKVLEKYQVTWLLIDKNTISPDAPKTLYYERIKTLFDQSSQVRQVESFGSIDVYRNENLNASQEFKSLHDNVVSVGPTYNWNNYDEAYINNDTYYSDINETNDPTILYPFRSLFTGKKQDQLEFEIVESNNGFVVKPQLNSAPKERYELQVPIETDELQQTSKTNLEVVKVINPVVRTNGQELENGNTYVGINPSNLEIYFPKVRGYYSFDSVIDTNLRALSEQRCDRFRPGKIDRFMYSERLLRLTSTDASNCMDVSIPNLSQRYSYLVTIESRNLTGNSLLFSVINKTSGKTEIQTYLPTSKELTTSYFIVPPMEFYGTGYSVHLDNISIGQDKTSNDVGKITVQPFPYRFISSIKLTKKDNESTPLLVYGQNYDKGWHAYQADNQLARLFPILFGKKLADHVLVNNWANGWKLSVAEVQGSKFKDQNIENTETIKIIYLPQYLEYVGFMLLGVGIVLPYFYSPKHSSR